jgi:serine/threonine-protein kinase HipA
LTDIVVCVDIETPGRRLTGVGSDVSDYLEIAEAISEYGANVHRDLHALYRRIVFNVAIHNTDDPPGARRKPWLRKHDRLSKMAWGLLARGVASRPTTTSLQAGRD